MKSPDLTPDIFPSDVDVIDFDPNGKFRIRTSASDLMRCDTAESAIPSFGSGLPHWLEDNYGHGARR